MHRRFLKRRNVGQFLDKYVETIGEANVVQLITDNAANYVLSSKKTSFSLHSFV